MGSPSMVPTGTLNDADDGTLVTAFLANRREAFDVVVERHWRNVYHLCYRSSAIMKTRPIWRRTSSFARSRACTNSRATRRSEPGSTAWA